VSGHSKPRGPSRRFALLLSGTILALGLPVGRGDAVIPILASPAVPPLPYVAVNGPVYTTVAWDHAGQTVHLYIYQAGTGGVWAITSLAVVQGATVIHLAGAGTGRATVMLPIAGVRVRAVMMARATLSAVYGIAAADGALFPYPVRAGTVDEHITLAFNAERALPPGLPARITLDRRATLASP